MSNLRQLIKEHLLLEKRIAQLMSSFKVQYAFEVDRTMHAHERRTRTGIENYNDREISNAELKYIIELALREIAENIALHNIIDEEAFVIKSKEKEIAIAVVPKHVEGSFWKLVIVTVFRESYDNSFRVGENQLVIWI
jgi:methylase of polypeptide subunit release factors